MVSSDNLGRYVRWQDGKGVEGGGHHTGRVVTWPSGREVGEEEGVRLVRESCDAPLSWVIENQLEPWLMRDEWEKE